MKRDLGSCIDMKESSEVLITHCLLVRAFWGRDSGNERHDDELEIDEEVEES